MSVLPVDSLETPRFVGVPTFMRLPQATRFDGLDAAIIGLPSDSGAPFRTGERFAPNAVRAMSVMLRPINPYRGGINIFERLRVADAGDAAVVPGYIEESLARIEAAVRRIVDAGATPFGIGGDHSVTLAELRAVASRARTAGARPFRRAQRHLGQIFRRQEIQRRHAVPPRRRGGHRRARPLDPGRHARLAVLARRRQPVARPRLRRRHHRRDVRDGHAGACRADRRAHRRRSRSSSASTSISSTPQPHPAW